MLILTPNRRLAAFSLQQHNAACVAQNLAAWATPQIMPVEAWLQEMWLRCAAYKPVLSAKQQQLILEQIIRNSKQGVELLCIEDTAKNVIDAWTSIKKYCVPLGALREYAQYTLDTAAFCAWIAEYESWLMANSRIDQQSLGDALLAEIPLLAACMPREICLRSMHDLPPQYAAIFAVLEEHGIGIVHDNLLVDSATVVRAGFSDTTQELSAAAAWAAAQQDAQRIGIVVPDLELRRQQIANVFLEHIPARDLNISAPLKLSNYPLIDTALLILQQVVPNLDYADLSILLRSPYVNTGKYDPNQCARLDRAFREYGAAKIATRQQRNTTLQHSTYWAALMQGVLQKWGWPGTKALSAVEADLFSCWQDLLREYCDLDFLLGAHAWPEAVQYLQRLAMTTPFAPAEVAASRVHMLGALEAEGILFDQLWIMGMTRDNWPMEAKPNPFIPFELQRQYNLPRCSPQRELQFAEGLTANLQRGATQQVIFSYALHVDDMESAASNLIVHLPEIIVPVPTMQAQTIALEKFVDNYAPMLSDSKVRGGTKVLKLQAQCPFKANAELRLRAEPLAQLPIFLTPGQRGSIVHEILEWYWMESGATELSTIIDLILKDWQWRYPLLLTDNYVAVERVRLNSLLQNWLLYEKQREKFSVVQLERRYAVQLGKLKLNIQVDRVDQLADGTHLVIDYKTGGIQPLDPQLAIYAHCIAPQAAVYYVRADKIVLQPYVPQEELDIEELADEFAAGFASVRPATSQICNSCQLQPLCRIHSHDY